MEPGMMDAAVCANQPSQILTNQRTARIDQLMATHNNPQADPVEQEQLLEILKANPRLMMALIKQRQQTAPEDQEAGPSNSQKAAKKKRKSTKTVDLTATAVEGLQEAPNEMDDHDRYQTFGNYVAAELRRFPEPAANRIQRKLARCMYDCIEEENTSKKKPCPTEASTDADVLHDIEDEVQITEDSADQVEDLDPNDTEPET